MKFIKLSIEQPLYDDSYYSTWHDSVWYTDDERLYDDLIKQILDNIPVEEKIDKYGYDNGRINMDIIEEYLGVHCIKRLEVDYEKEIERIPYE